MFGLQHYVRGVTVWYKPLNRVEISYPDQSGTRSQSLHYVIRSVNCL